MKYNFLITAGGTSEKIDNVRKITNCSSGKLGSVIANQLIENYLNIVNKIYYICSNNAILPTENEKIEVIKIEDTNDLLKAVKILLTTKHIDYFIHSMAVSDYAVDYVTTIERIAEKINSNKDETLTTLLNFDDILTDKKISSYEDNLVIKLKRTPKIISLIKDLSPKTFLVGFKLLDSVSKQKLFDVAIKLKDKNRCDLVVANDINDIRNGNHKALIIKKDNSFVEANGKDDIAKKLLKEILYDKWLWGILCWKFKRWNYWWVIFKIIRK